jgi:type IV pilus assembly protein PilB
MPLPFFGENKDIALLRKVLIDQGYIEEVDFNEAKKHTDGITVQDLIEDLIKSEHISKETLRQAYAEFFKIPPFNPEGKQFDEVFFNKVPQTIREQYRFIIYKDTGSEAIVVVDDPARRDLLKNIQDYVTSPQVSLLYVLPSDIDDIVKTFRKKISQVSNVLSTTQKSVTGVDPALVKLFDDIVDEALSMRTSDIHIEPFDQDVLVRFRVDGILQEITTLSKDHYQNLLNRIKIQANLRIDEHMTLQDGSIRISRGSSFVDMRVSIVPTIMGEKVVIRMLTSYVHGLSIDSIGLSSKAKELITTSLKKPYGMIIVVGPTGSGKTTTLYTILQNLNTKERNITTIEDPVEYKIPGLNQIQVNPTANVTFANGLRSIVRQDPNVILVGEIRDQETAEIAINAALTGHLLLTTFHANNAATTMPRLLDMGIEPFLLSSALEIIISQRLVRSLCQNCRYSVDVDIENIENLVPHASRYFSSGKTTLYASKGCHACGDTGFKGRIAVFEIVPISNSLRDLIPKKPSIDEITSVISESGFISMFEDGIEKVKDGITSLEELIRVVHPPLQ